MPWQVRSGCSRASSCTSVLHASSQAPDPLPSAFHLEECHWLSRTSKGPPQRPASRHESLLPTNSRREHTLSGRGRGPAPIGGAMQRSMVGTARSGVILGRKAPPSSWEVSSTSGPYFSRNKRKKKRKNPSPPQAMCGVGSLRFRRLDSPSCWDTNQPRVGPHGQPRTGGEA